MSLLNGWLLGRNAAIPVSCSQTSKTPMAPRRGPSPSSRSHSLAPQSGLLCIGGACLQASFLRRSACQDLRWVHSMHVNVGARLPSTPHKNISAVSRSSAPLRAVAFARQGSCVRFQDAACRVLRSFIVGLSWPHHVPEDGKDTGCETSDGRNHKPKRKRWTLGKLSKQLEPCTISPFRSCQQALFQPLIRGEF